MQPALLEAFVFATAALFWGLNEFAGRAFSHEALSSQLSLPYMALAQWIYREHAKCYVMLIRCHSLGSEPAI